jgi:predicted TIM-barrel fold metal-dependent hydrolase
MPDYMTGAFDAHFHLLPSDVYDNSSFFNPSWGDIDASISAMDEAGVSRALVSYPTTDYHIKTGVSPIEAARVYNDNLNTLVQGHSGRLYWLAALPLTEAGEMAVEMDRAVADGAAGVSLPTNTDGVYPDDITLRPFFEKADSKGLPVFIHPTTMTPFGNEALRHPLITPVFQYAFDTTICLAKVVASGMLRELPGLKLIFASFGGAMPFFAGRFDRTYEMLLGRGIVPDYGELPVETLGRVYVDTSGTTSPTLLRLAVEVFGENRVLWGSDYPANRDVAGSLAAIRGIGLDESEVAMISGGTLESLLS